MGCCVALAYLVAVARRAWFSAAPGAAVRDRALRSAGSAAGTGWRRVAVGLTTEFAIRRPAGARRPAAADPRRGRPRLVRARPGRHARPRVVRVGARDRSSSTPRSIPPAFGSPPAAPRSLAVQGMTTPVTDERVRLLLPTPAARRTSDRPRVVSAARSRRTASSGRSARSPVCSASVRAWTAAGLGLALPGGGLAYGGHPVLARHRLAGRRRLRLHLVGDRSDRAPAAGVARHRPCWAVWSPTAAPARRQRRRPRPSVRR